MSNLKKDRKSFDVIANIEHEDSMGAKRVVDAGIVPGTVYGNNSATAQLIGKGTSILVTNTTATIGYIKFGDAAVGVPTITDGIAVPPNGQLTLNSGAFDFVRTSANSIQVVVFG